VDDFAKNLLYPEVPAYYVWDKKKFQRRKRGVNAGQISKESTL